MAITHVQAVTGDWSSGTSWNTSITATNGNMLAVVVFLYAGDSANSFSSISDGTNTYDQVDIQEETIAGSKLTLVSLYGKNITGGSLTVTTNITGVSVVAAKTVIAEISGADTTSPLDQHTDRRQDNPGSGTDAVSSGAVTTTANGEYIVAATLSSNNDGISHGTDYTDLFTATTLFLAERQIQTSQGSINGTFTAADGSNSFLTNIMTFKPGGTLGRLILTRPA